MYIEGTDYYDCISFENNENDSYYLKKGNDRVKDYSGDDTYLFNLGDGKDVITDTSGIDTLEFGEGINADDLIFSRNNNSVIVYIANTNDSVTIVDWYHTDTYKMEQIKLNDGTVLTSEDVENIIANISMAINESDENDTIYGSAGNDIINANAGDDFVYSKEGNDTIFGSSGNDNIFAEEDDDLIKAGIGDDFIKGGSGNDTYIFNKGDGHDTIYDPDNNDTGGNDTIKFGSGIALSDLSFLRNSYNLEIAINNSEDRITVNDYYFPSENYETKIETIEFSDGSSITSTEIENIINTQTLTFIGTDGDDVIYGTPGNDIIDGLAGNDSLYGGFLVEGNYIDTGTGDDTLTGGLGNDNLVGSDGNDTYIFNKGDGQDVIIDLVDGSGGAGGTADVLKFGPGITKNDLIVTAEFSTLVISIKGTTDKIYVNGWAPQEFGDNKIEKIQFNDGSSLTATDLENMIPRKYTGTKGSDTIFGSWFNDTITGGKGNDTLYGGLGSDTYIFNKGDGRDTILDLGVLDTDTIKFGSGINRSCIRLAREGELDFNLAIYIKNTNDKITVENYFYPFSESVDGMIERIKFADGTSLRLREIENLSALQTYISPTTWGTQGNNKFSGHSKNSIYYAEEGNDTIKDSSGNDTYLFFRGDGQDRIKDYKGSDKIIFGSGIEEADLTFLKVATDDLQIEIRGTDDKIIIWDWYRSSKYQIEKIQFNDGSYMTNSEINEIIQTIAAQPPQNGGEIISTNISNNNDLLLVSSN